MYPPGFGRRASRSTRGVHAPRPYSHRHPRASASRSRRAPAHGRPLARGGPEMDKTIPQEAGADVGPRRDPRLEPARLAEGAGKRGPLCRFFRGRPSRKSETCLADRREDAAAALRGPMDPHPRGRLFRPAELEGSHARPRTAPARPAGHGAALPVGRSAAVERGGA